MGMYDVVLVPCPKCGEETEFQSKGGDCLLLCYKLSEAPTNVLNDVNRHSPYYCTCGTSFKVNLEEVRVIIETTKLVGTSVGVIDGKTN